MQKLKLFYLLLATVLSLISSPSFGEEIYVHTPSGDSLAIEVSAEDRFCEVFNQIDAYLASLDADQCLLQSSHHDEFMLEYTRAAPPQSRQAAQQRDYNRPVTAAEKEDIGYIVKNLATNTWTQLLRHRSSLKKAGERVDHVHPLRFLMCIFTDEELKGGIHSINGRGGKIWREFYSGLADSLEEESTRGNMESQVIKDFAHRVGVKVDLITPHINEHRWSAFIEVLIKNIPRGGNPDRYDM